MPLVAVTGVEVVGIDTLNLPAALAGHCNGRVESIKNCLSLSPSLDRRAHRTPTYVMRTTNTVAIHDLMRMKHVPRTVSEKSKSVLSGKPGPKPLVRSLVSTTNAYITVRATQAAVVLDAQKGERGGGL